MGPGIEVRRELLGRMSVLVNLMLDVEEFTGKSWAPRISFGVASSSRFHGAAFGGDRGNCRREGTSTINSTIVNARTTQKQLSLQ